MGRHKTNGMEKAFRMFDNGADPKAAWKACGKPSTWRNFDRQNKARLKQQQNATRQPQKSQQQTQQQQTQQQAAGSRGTKRSRSRRDASAVCAGRRAVTSTAPHPP